MLQRRVSAIVAAVGVLLSLAGLALYAWLARSLPRVSGTIGVAGLEEPVEIVRDRHGVPHVFSALESDAYFGLGYVHAQDRLWQLELGRRLGAGRLAEVFGQDALASDRLFRTLGLWRAAARDAEQLSAGARVALAAYVRGVNAFLEAAPALPPEFAVFGLVPERWLAADSLVWLKVMAWILSGNLDSELARLRLSGTLTERQVSEFLAPYPGDVAPVIRAPADLYGALRAPARALWATFGGVSPGLGSNNWAIAGSRSRSGKPLLANDPHLDLSAPSSWYLAHLNAPGLNVIGATLPGLPGVVLGRTDRVAWAFTNTESDTQDLFVEKLLPEDGARYLGPDGSLPFETRRELIRVKGGAEVQLEVRETRHGPVISDVEPRARALMPPGHVVALAWSALMPGDRSLEFVIDAARAQSGGELLEAARSYHGAQQNIVYADTSGEIGFVAAGRVPLRGADNDLLGLLPAPGWLARYDWRGVVPFDELPQQRQPALGRIVTANQKITAPDYPHLLGFDWAPPFRARRIERLLDETPLHDLTSFAALQSDVHSNLADTLLPTLIGAGRSQPALSADAEAALRRLERWDHEMSADRLEPLLFAAWLRELSRVIYADDLAADFADFWWDNSTFLCNVLEPGGAQTHWCDDVGTPAVEACDTRQVLALERSVAYLRERFGPRWQSQVWGDVHVARAAHLPLGSVPVIGRWFNVELPTPGGNDTVNVGGYTIDDPEEPFVSRRSAGLRALYDLGAPEASLVIVTPGQSGHVLSRHYRDLAPDWLEGRYVPMITARAAVERGAQGTLRLEPKL